MFTKNRTIWSSRTTITTFTPKQKIYKDVNVIKKFQLFQTSLPTDIYSLRYWQSVWKLIQGDHPNTNIYISHLVFQSFNVYKGIDVSCNTLPIDVKGPLSD